MEIFSGLSVILTYNKLFSFFLFYFFSSKTHFMYTNIHIYTCFMSGCSFFFLLLLIFLFAIVRIENFAVFFSFSLSFYAPRNRLLHSYVELSFMHCCYEFMWCLSTNDNFVFFVASLLVDQVVFIREMEKDKKKHIIFMFHIINMENYPTSGIWIHTKHLCERNQMHMKTNWMWSEHRGKWKQRTQKKVIIYLLPQTKYVNQQSYYDRWMSIMHERASSNNEKVREREKERKTHNECGEIWL